MPTDTSAFERDLGAVMTVAGNTPFSDSEDDQGQSHGKQVYGCGHDQGVNSCTCTQTPLQLQKTWELPGR